MSVSTKKRTGGQILIDVLLSHGVDRIFCVAGESYIAALDALYDVRDRVKIISCRHESGAAFMAEAYGKMTGKPGICFVTRGPGACNAAIGIHTAFQDQTPLIMFIGQVSRDVFGREGFQEIDFRAMFAPVAKWATQIESAGRIPEIMNRAFSLANSGRPGPIVIALPEDTLSDMTESVAIGPAPIPQSAADAASVEKMQKILAAAQKPLVILGGGGWTEKATKQIQKFCENNRLPTAAAFRRQDLMDNCSPSYVGDLNFGPDPALVKRVMESDVILAIGDRIGEVTSREFSAFTIPQMRQKLIHVQSDPDALNHIYRADVAIAASLPQFAAQISDIKLDSARWQAWSAGARADYENARTPTQFDVAVDLSKIMLYLNDHLADDAITTNDAGNYAGWLHRFYQWRQYGTQLAPGNGAMGYAVPAAIAASILHPTRDVLCWVGDGGFMMTGQEIASAMQCGAKPVICIVNNNMYGTIRMHQERHYPGRVIATELVNPDFAALAKSYGAFGVKIAKTTDFADAFTAAKKSGTLAVIEIPIDADMITSRTTIAAIRKAAGQ